jgi:hypothetical protein
MDRITEALVEALRTALTEPSEQRLYRSGKLPGLFAGRTGAAGQAAARALGDGLFEVARTETKGKVVTDWARLTPRGVEFLHEHESPARALREVRDALRVNHEAIPAWLAEMRTNLRALDDRLAADAGKWLQRLEALTRRVEEALTRLEAATPLLPPDLSEAHPWAADALDYLDRRRAGGAADGCPLPELFAALRPTHPDLAVADFHDGLRRLHERRSLRLQPAADPADLPQPEYALLDGGAVLYYATR